MSTPLGRLRTSRLLIGGLFWAVVYNLIWGVAWLAFMRQEWLDAATSAKTGLPWTPEVLALWAGLTVPIGVAVMWYCASNRLNNVLPLKPAIYSSAAMWLLMSVSMIVWAAMTSLPMRVIALDSAVNLGAIAAATLSGVLLHRGALVRDRAS